MLDVFITAFNSNKSLSLNDIHSKKRYNDLDELTNIATKAEERSIIRISFKNIKTGTIQNPRQNSQLIYDPLC